MRTSCIAQETIVNQCDDLSGRKSKREDVCICMADSFCCMVETTEHHKVAHIPKKKKKIKNLAVKGHSNFRAKYCFILFCVGSTTTRYAMNILEWV